MQFISYTLDKRKGVVCLVPGMSNVRGNSAAAFPFPVDVKFEVKKVNACKLRAKI
jgi:hypothetical protein